MRDHGGVLSFAPRLPERLTRLAFRIGFRGARLHVEVSDSEVTYRQLQATHPLGIEHFGHKVTVPTGSSLTLPVPAAAAHPEPVRQPSGRTPVRRQPPQP